MVWDLPADGRVVADLEAVLEAALVGQAVVDSVAAQAGNLVAAVDLDGHQAAVVVDTVAALAGSPAVVVAGNQQIIFPHALWL